MECQSIQSALWYAAEANDIKVINMLLKAGINNNHKDHEGISLLFIAVYRGYVKAVSCLLKHGVDIDIEHAKWRKPLSCNLELKK